MNELMEQILETNKNQLQASKDQLQRQFIVMFVQAFAQVLPHLAVIFLLWQLSSAVDRVVDRVENALAQLPAAIAGAVGETLPSAEDLEEGAEGLFERLPD